LERDDAATTDWLTIHFLAHSHLNKKAPQEVAESLFISASPPVRGHPDPLQRVGVRIGSSGRQ
jgi:hypothetical protein